MKSLISACIIILCSVSCNLLDSNDQEIDSRLIGEWVAKGAYNQAYGPKEFISGIQIRENGQVYLLAIETATGKLTLDSDSVGIILEAAGNAFVFKNHRVEMLLSSKKKGSYIFKNDSLFLLTESGNLDGKYQRSIINFRITSPKTSQFSIKINDNSYLTEKVSRAPSAYAYFLDNRLSIISRGNDNSMNHSGFQINVENFNGIGTYDTSTTHIFYEVVQGDMILVSSTTFVLSEVNLEIETINENQISGKLNFNIAGTVFSDGIFDVPVY